jgi:hypothetical protein
MLIRHGRTTITPKTLDIRRRKPAPRNGSTVIDIAVELEARPFPFIRGCKGTTESGRSAI